MTMNTTYLQKQIFSAVGSILLAAGIFFTGYTQASAAFGDLIWSIDSAGDNFSDAAADATGVYTGRNRYGYFFYTVTTPLVQKWSPSSGALLSKVTSVAPYGVRYVSFDGSDNIKISMWGGSWEIRRKSDLGLVSVYVDPSPDFDVNDLAGDNNTKMRNVYDNYSRTSLSLEQNSTYTGFNSSWPSYLQIEAATEGVVNRVIYSIPKGEWMTKYTYGPYTVQGEAAQLWYGPYSMEPDDLGNVYIVGGADNNFDVGRIQKREAPPPYVSPEVRFVDVTAFTYGPVYKTVSKGDVISVGWDSGDTTSCSVISGADSGFQTGNATAGFDTTVTPLYDKTVFTVQCIATDGTVLTASDTVTVTGGLGIPDLTANMYSMPTNVIAGVSTTFSAIIYNNGTASTDTSFPYFFQVASLADGNGGITDLSASTHPVLSNVGSVSPKDKAYTFPTAGTYSMRACADKSSSTDGGVIAESDESNNCSTWGNVTVSMSNLKASSVAPTTAFAGKTTAFSATITNEGAASTGNSFVNKIELASQSDGLGTIQEFLISRAALASGTSAVSSISYIFPTAGTYSMRACADSSNSIPETSENDNCSPWVDVVVTESTTPIVPSATLSAYDCTIARGMSTCWSYVVGTVTDALSPNFYNQTTGELYVTGSSVGQIKEIVYGENTIQARNGTDVLLEIYPAAMCGSSNVWDGEYCVAVQCVDNTDNDGDGFIDYDGTGDASLVDPGCVDSSDDDENDSSTQFTDVVCSDGIDNDSDGYTDFNGAGTPADADPGCISATDTSEFNIGAIRPR